MSTAIPLVTACAAVAQPGFWLTGLPSGGSAGVVRGLSHNGSVAVGINAVQPAHPAAGFRWTRAGGREDWGLLPGMPSYTPAFAVDSTGTTMVGWAGENYPADRAFRRAGNRPLQYLGVLQGQTWSRAAGISGDGAIVVGASEHEVPGPIPGTGGQAFRWTESGGMQGLGYLRPNGVHSQAMGISRDGSTIVGSSQSGSIFGDVEAFRWTEGGGMQVLPNLPNAPYVSYSAWAVNATGTIIAGEAASPASGTTRAVRWTSQGVEDLGALPGYVRSFAYAMDDSGNVIGGLLYAGLPNAGFIWTPGTGMLLLSDYLALHSVGVPSDYRLEAVYAISGDGLTFAGEARNLITNAREGFVATIPSPATAVVLLAVPLLCTRRRFRSYAPRHCVRFDPR